MSKFVQNEENANRLLEWLDHGAPHTAFALQVTVGSYEESYHEVATEDEPDDDRNCGAVACMAGAASLMHDGTFGLPNASMDSTWEPIQTKAIAFLGIDVDELPEQIEHNMLDVFSPRAAEQFGNIDHATAYQSAQALRNFIEFGDPRWEEIH